MAKNKKSKILAMALCASVMAGIYAAPVMAEDLSVTLDGQGIVANEVVGVTTEQHDVTGTLTIAGADIATALNGTNLTLNSVTANTISTTGDTVVGGTLTAAGAANLNSGLTVTGGDTFIDGGRLHANKGLTVSSDGILIEEGGDLSLAGGNVDVGGTLNVTGDTTLKNTTVNGTLTAGATTVDSLTSTGNATVGGTLEVTGDTTLAGLKAGATTVDSLKSNGNAEVGGTLAVTGDTTLAGLTAGATTVDSLTVNGAATVDSLEVAKGIEAANGKFQLTEAGVLTVNGRAAFTKGVTVQNGLSVTGGASVDGNFAVTNGGLSVSGGESVLNGGLTVNNGDAKLNGKLDVGAGNFKVDTAGNTEFNGNLNIGHGNFTVDATTGNTVVKGSLELGTLPGKEVGQAIKDLEAYAEDLKDANLPDKVGGIERDPASAGDPGTGTTTIENGAEFTETAMTMGDTIVESGKITVGAEGDQTIIEGGAITAKSLVLDGKNVGETIFGIVRDPENEVTTIEGATSFDATGMSIKNADGFGTSLGVAGMEITAAGGLSTRFTAGGATFVGASASDTTTINGGAIQTNTINGVNFSEWHDKVDDRLDVLEDKTQNIKPGTGEGGASGLTGGEDTITVPDTAPGHTGVNGDVTVGGEINAGEIVVGDKDSDNKTTIDGGNITVNGGENGSTTINGGNITTGDINAGTGNIGGIDMAGGTIKTGDTTIDGNGIETGDAQFNDKVTVGKPGGENGQTFIDGGTITTGDTTINGGGVTVGGSDGVSIKDDGMTVGEGTDIKDGNITVKGDEGKVEIGKGDVAIFDENGEKVTSIQHNYDEINRVEEKFDGEVNRLDNRITKVEDRIDKVGAMSAAIANLRTMGYDPAAPTEIAVGVGQYRSETGVALGMFHYPNKDFMLSLSVSTSGDEVMGGIGATWKFGRKSPEKVLAAEKEKAAKAKLAKAEAMKKAAKEAKIKAQQERHAKLAAERAAQAEAAK